MASFQKELRNKAKTVCVQVLREFCFVGTVSEINVATQSYHRFILLCHALIYQVFLVGGLASTHTDRQHSWARALGGARTMASDSKQVTLTTWSRSPLVCVFVRENAHLLQYCP